MFQRLEEARLQEIHFRADPDTGLRAIVAIHDSRRGPAIGGCRFIPYADDQAAIEDAIRLARGMSYKAALAGLPHGGGKSVILYPSGEFDRAALFASFGRFVEDLGGRYITAMDSGTQVSDMDAIATSTSFVTCTSREGDPSPHTAQGVFAGLRAAVRFKLGREDLKGIRVAIQGLGHVGQALAERLAAAGAHLLVTDIDTDKIRLAEARWGAEVVSPERIHRVPCDVFSPCGLGASLNRDTVEALSCPVVAGSANNQLADAAIGKRLHERGILYAPDYLINAGGLIFVALGHAGRPAKEITQRVEEIGDTLFELFTQAESARLPCHIIADRMAEEVLYRSAPSTAIP